MPISKVTFDPLLTRAVYEDVFSLGMLLFVLFISAETKETELKYSNCSWFQEWGSGAVYTLYYKLQFLKSNANFI